jgi:hypothetical protein
MENLLKKFTLLNNKELCELQNKACWNFLFNKNL